MSSAASRCRPNASFSLLRSPSPLHDSLSNDMAWDIGNLDQAQTMSRIRSHYGEDWFPQDEDLRWEFDETPEGYDLLPAAGIFATVRRGDFVWYAGSIGPLDHRALNQHRQFEYTPAETEGEGQDAPGADNASDADVDEHRADDPNALLPRQNQQVWLGQIREIFSAPAVGQEGEEAARTYVLMRGYATGDYLRHALPTRWEAVSEYGLVDNMHGREHVRLDTWEFCRAHDIVALAEPVYMDDATAHLPPPLTSTTTARAFVAAGVVHYVDEIRNSTAHRPLEHRRPPGYSPIACEYEECTDRRYNRGTQEVAQCLVCRSWFHTDCLELAEAAVDWERARVNWNGGQAQGPPIRREPNLDAAEFLPAARGVWIRADVPVKTWGRATDAVERAKLETLAQDGEIGLTDGEGFKTRFRARIQVGGGGEFGGLMTGGEVEEAQTYIQDEHNWLLYKCRVCASVM
ncbi:unnamed protein product [Peniophora sp. CBMAI 1063]|nr:unnamed protein product [Peniophora sp. CBMAI 1063]